MKRRHAFTLVELLVVIGIIALLISILLPSLNKAREQAASLKCLSNLRQMGNAVQQYANANRGYLVPGSVIFPGDPANGDRDNWATILVAGKYLPAPPQEGSTNGNTFADTSFGDSVFRCPSGIDNRVLGADGVNPSDVYDQRGAGFFRRFSSITVGKEGVSPGLRVDSWYGVNGCSIDGTLPSYPTAANAFARWPFTRIPETVAGQPQGLHKLAQFRSAASLVLIYDGVMHNQRIRYVNARHLKRTRCNMLFADGHADSIDIKDVLKLAEPTAAPTETNTGLMKYAPGSMRFILRGEPSLPTS